MMLKPMARFILLSGLVFCLFRSTTTTYTDYSHFPESVNSRDKNFSYDFSVKDATGKKIDFNEFKGKVLFINLWATWCGPCRAEMPAIQQLYNETVSDQIKFVMLSLDQEKTVKNIEGYIKSNGYTFPVYNPSGFLPEQFQVSYIPTTLIVSKQGKILMTLTGGTDFHNPKYEKLLEDEAAM